MQQELQNLQPELIKTSANTEQLMVKIEQDTIEVEAKREVQNTRALGQRSNSCRTLVIKRDLGGPEVEYFV